MKPTAYGAERGVDVRVSICIRVNLPSLTDPLSSQGRCLACATLYQGTHPRITCQPCPRTLSRMSPAHTTPVEYRVEE